MVILIDNGHGSNTEQNGNFSPKLTSDMNIGGEFTNDGRFREWKYNRVIANIVTAELKSMGYDARLLVPGDGDTSLDERIRCVNSICNIESPENVILVSIHANEKGSGDSWHDTKGWGCYTEKGKINSHKLADLLYNSAKQNVKNREIIEDWTDDDTDKEVGFYLIKKSYCPAVLTENFFYDNKDDLEYMTSDEGVYNVVKLHVKGIVDYITSTENE